MGTKTINNQPLRSCLLIIVKLDSPISFIYATIKVSHLCNTISNLIKRSKGIVMKDDKNYSFKGSPNAGLVLSILAIIGAILVFSVGFWG